MPNADSGNGDAGAQTLVAEEVGRARQAVESEVRALRTQLADATEAGCVRGKHCVVATALVHTTAHTFIV